MTLQNKPRPNSGWLLASAVFPGVGQIATGYSAQGLSLLVIGLLAAVCYNSRTIVLHYAGWLATILVLFCTLLLSPALFFFKLPVATNGLRRWWLLPVSLIGALLASSVWLGILGFVAGMHSYSIGSKSMVPTLYEGDRVFVDQHFYRSHPLSDGDILAFRHNGYILAKRVSALPGETIEGRNGTLLRNGTAISEPYVRFSPENSLDVETFASRKMAEGEVFVTGDSRDASLDSRSDEFGVVHTSDIVGRVAFIYASNHDQTGRSF